MKCEECKYCYVQDSTPENEWFECRRRAPRIVEAMVAPANKKSQRYADMTLNEFEAYAVWPTVLEGDWCGDFEAKK